MRGTRLTDRLTGSAGANSLDGGERNDWIDGGEGNNILLGGEGNDERRGGRGADTLDGGTRSDGAQFSEPDTVRGIRVKLAQGLAIDGWGFRDVLRSIESVSGTRLADFFVGNGEDTFFQVYDGGDLYVGGAGDFDQIDFRGGAVQGVFVDIAAGRTIDQFGNHERFNGIEGIRGTRLADLMRGSGGSEKDSGLVGADILDGGSGADRLVFALGHSRPESRRRSSTSRPGSTASTPTRPCSRRCGSAGRRSRGHGPNTALRKAVSKRTPTATGWPICASPSSAAR